jgi:hypothetical protein
VGSLNDRLNRLEAQVTQPQSKSIPIEVRVLLTAIERRRAALRGEEPPPYSSEEQAAMHEDDLEIVAGGGVVGWLRDSGGWGSPEALAFLAEWEEDARRRVAAM